MVTAIIQARVGSTRLPNKVFCDLSGKPLIWHVCDRLKYSKLIDNIILATTVSANDNILEKWGNENKIKVFRGSEEDVLSRYYHAAVSSNSRTIVRVTADDPFKDPEIIDQVIRMLQNEKLDFCFNNNPSTFPEGLDTEVFTIDALEAAYEKSNDSFEREHVTQYFYRNTNQFKMKNYLHKSNLSHLRWTIDTKEDYLMASMVYNELYKEGRIFLLDDILKLLDEKPEIEKINNSVERSTMYSNNN